MPMPFLAKSKGKVARSKVLRTAHTESTLEQPETRTVEVRSQSWEVESTSSYTPAVLVAQTNNAVPSAVTRSETKKLGGSSSSASTSLNVLKLSLETLRDVSGRVPVAGIKGSVSFLLSVIIKCQPVSEDAQGFRDLAERINHLEPILRVVHQVDNKTGTIMLALSDLIRELNELAAMIESALSQGKLSRFFQSSGNASSIKYHIDILDGIITGLSRGLSNTGQSVNRLHRGGPTVQSAVAFSSRRLQGTFSDAGTDAKASPKRTGDYVASYNDADRFLQTMDRTGSSQSSAREAKPNSVLHRLTKAVKESHQRFERMQTTIHVQRMKYALKDLADKLKRNDSSDPSDLLPLVDPFDRLPRVFGRMDVGDEGTSHFFDEVEGELLVLIKTLDAISRGESHSPKNAVEVHASRLHHLIEGYDVIQSRLDRNGIRVSDTKPVRQREVEADRRDSPWKNAPVGGLDMNLSGARVELENGFIGSRNTGLRNLDMRNGIFKVKGGSIGCDNIASNTPILDQQMGRSACT